MGWLAQHDAAIIGQFLGPLRPPRHPLITAGFGLLALAPASGFARRLFQTEAARGWFAGCAAHAILPLEQPATAAFGLILGMLAHAVGWPLARGGSARIAEALARRLQALGGDIVTGMEIRSLRDLPPARHLLLDITPRQFVRIAGDSLPPRYRRQLARYRYGPGIFKCDYALSEPIPWRAPGCAQAVTVHLGGTLDAIRRSERAAWDGQHDDAPYTLVVQPTLFDASRAPAGRHIAWAYCHVPNGSTLDMASVIDRQIERFAPGFRDCVLARRVHDTAQMEAYNPNYIGGDINGGAQDLRQLFTRPTPRLNPYSTPLKGVYLCSSATPPGGGVHGMCGYHAALAALRQP
jgi:phytoene dehydrogenase-like protein